MASKKKGGQKPMQKSSVPLIPLADRVVVRPLSPEERGLTTASGIIIPDSAQEKSSEGIVLAVGPGRFDDGARMPMTVSVNDRVIFSKYGHEEVKINGMELMIVSESNILAIIKT